MGIGLLVGGVRRDPWISWTPPPPGGGALEGGGTPFLGGAPPGSKETLDWRVGLALLWKD